MKYIEAPFISEPADYELRPTIFMAGGITGCPDWQSTLLESLSDVDVGLMFNPRRKTFQMGDASVVEAQIKWEASHLDICDAILFWFASDTIQPIVLYELGAWSMTDKPLFIGVHPNYVRKHDVVIQTLIKRPEVVIVDSLSALSEQIREFILGVK